MNITILFSLPTKRITKSSYLAADEDTVLSAQKVSQAIELKGATVSLVALSEDSIPEIIRGIRADLIFNLIDWTGVDLPLSFLAMDELEAHGISFTGSTRENFTLVDKIVMKTALQKAHIPTAQWQVFQTGDELLSTSLSFPVLVKLSREHCSVGIEKTSLVTNKTDLVPIIKDRIARFGQDVYIEEFINGREFQITVLEYEHGPVMLPPSEIVYKPSHAPEFLTFTERWNQSDPMYQRSHTVLATLTQEQLRMFETITLSIFHNIGFRDYTRIDARLTSQNELIVLEANPNPGLDDDQLYSMTISARAAGLSFSDFIWAIVESAIRRTKKA